MNKSKYNYFEDDGVNNYNDLNCIIERMAIEMVIYDKKNKVHKEMFKTIKFNDYNERYLCTINNHKIYRNVYYTHSKETNRLAVKIFLTFDKGKCAFMFADQYLIYSSSGRIKTLYWHEEERQLELKEIKEFENIPFIYRVDEMTEYTGLQPNEIKDCQKMLKKYLRKYWPNKIAE